MTKIIYHLTNYIYLQTTIIIYIIYFFLAFKKKIFQIVDWPSNIWTSNNHHIYNIFFGFQKDFFSNCIYEQVDFGYPVSALWFSGYFIIWISNLLTLSIPDEDYSRNPCAHYITYLCLYYINYFYSITNVLFMMV